MAKQGSQPPKQPTTPLPGKKGYTPPPSPPSKPKPPSSGKGNK